jgi:hypothetical protein
MNNCCIWWFFYAYIYEIHGSRNKIPSKNLVRHRCAEGFNSSVEGLKPSRHAVDRTLSYSKTIISSYLEAISANSTSFELNCNHGHM